MSPDRHAQLRLVDEVLEPSRLKEVFRPYYLNSEKIDTYFIQRFGDLSAFAMDHEKETKKALGGELKGKSLLSLLTGLEIGARADLSQRKQEGHRLEFSVGPLARFNLLRAYWTEEEKTPSLEKLLGGHSFVRHQLVSGKVTYSFLESPDAHQANLSLSAGQLQVIRRKYDFEQRYEAKPHFIIVFHGHKPAVAILSTMFVTHVGYRYLEGAEKDTAYFTGACIREEQSLLFLDPIALGEFAPI